MIVRDAFLYSREIELALASPQDKAGVVLKASLTPSSPIVAP
jgi:hypothetical protein